MKDNDRKRATVCCSCKLCLISWHPGQFGGLYFVITIALYETVNSLPKGEPFPVCSVMESN